MWSSAFLTAAPLHCHPINLLAGEKLQWFAIASQTAKLTFTYNQLSSSLIITFNKADEIGGEEL
jgi:hypothetical protein